MAGLLLSFILICFFHEIQGQALPPPELTVNPPVITETDSVTLSCQTPSYISVFRCHINTVTGVPIETSSCRRTLTGTELLKISHQSSPSEVQVICYYSVQLGYGNSPYSDTSSINIQSFIQGQALPPPKLTVNPPVITETDSVILICQTPSYISVTRCYFFTATQRISEDDCVQTLKLSELLKMVQRLPADIEVRCFYTVKSGASSPHSEISTITIKTLPSPKLTVNSTVITETDSATLNCVTPSSLSVSHCYFYTVNETTIETSSSSCRRTLTGTELLKISQQSSPSDVQVRCFYNVQLEYVNFQSLFSDISSITIQSQKPELSLQSLKEDDIFFTCLLPGSVKHGTRCNLYLGEVNRPILTTTAKQKRSKTKQWFCRFTVRVDDLLRYLDSVQHKDASCDYKLEHEQNSLSPRSDRKSLTDIVTRESSMMSKNSTFTVTPAGSNVTMSSASTPPTSVNRTSGSLPANLSPPNTVTPRGNDADAVGRESSVSTRSAFIVTTGLTVIMSDVSTPATSVNQTSEENVGLKLLLPVGFGASVAVIFLVLVLRRRLKRRTATISRSGRSSSKTNANITDDSMCLRNINHGGVELPDNNTYSLITSVPGADCSTGFEKLNREEPQSQDSDIYHLYDTIPEQPTASDRPDMLYSLLQAH